MSLIATRLPSGAHVTDFFFFPNLFKPELAPKDGVPLVLGGVFDEPGGGVAESDVPIAGDPLRPFAIDLRTS